MDHEYVIAVICLSCSVIYVASVIGIILFFRMVRIADEEELKHDPKGFLNK